MPFKMTKEDEVLDAKTVERIDASEARMGRLEEAVQSFVAEFRESFRAEMMKHFGIASAEEDLSAD